MSAEVQRSFEDLVADLRALLAYVGAKGRSLTTTGRLRLADVRAINERLRAPETLDHEMGGKSLAFRTEDEAPRVHLLRLLAEAGGLVEAQRRRLALTVRGREVADGGALNPATLFADWWWQGAWDLLPRGFAVARGPEEDRAVTGRALRTLGEAETALPELGERLLSHFGPPAPVHPDLHVNMWARTIQRTCLEPLAAFGGCVLRSEHRRVEPFTPGGLPMEYDEAVAVRITAEGLALLDAALGDGRPRLAERRSAIPEQPGVPVGTSGPRSAAERMAAAERARRVASAHPEIIGPAARGDGEARAHLLLHEGLEEMLDSGDLPIANETYARLVAAGHDTHDVEHLIADALTREVWEMEQDGLSLDPERLGARLSALLSERLAGASVGPPAIDPRTLERLRGLPRSNDVWEGAVRRLPSAMTLGLGSGRVAVWAVTRGALPRGIEPREGDDVTALLRGFVDAALRAGAGFRRELPSRLRVSDAATAAALRHAVEPLGIPVDVVPHLPALDLLLGTVASFLDSGVGRTRRSLAGGRRRARSRRRN